MNFLFLYLNIIYVVRAKQCLNGTVLLSLGNACSKLWIRSEGPKDSSHPDGCFEHPQLMF